MDADLGVMVALRPLRVVVGWSLIAVGLWLINVKLGASSDCRGFGLRGHPKDFNCCCVGVYSRKVCANYRRVCADRYLVDLNRTEKLFIFVRSLSHKLLILRLHSTVQIRQQFDTIHLHPQCRMIHFDLLDITISDITSVPT